MGTQWRGFRLEVERVVPNTLSLEFVPRHGAAIICQTR